jgi:hypothetical protein
VKWRNIGYDVGQTFDGKNKKKFDWSYIDFIPKTKVAIICDP